MMRRICVSRAWKQAHRSRLGDPPRGAGATTAGPLFQGTVYLANMHFAGTGGPWAIPAIDLATVVQYLGRVVNPIAGYASQYGPTRLTAGPLLPPFTATVANGQYTDQQLQGWISQVVQATNLPAGSAVLVLNPPGLVNQDARERGGVGVLGYHGFSSVPYSFVNALGSGFTLDDRADLYAEAVSHEIAEMTVDPRADASNPEVCDGCGTNCRGPSAYRSFFDTSGRYIGSDTAFPPPFPFEFFVSAIARPAAASDCPAPTAACAYSPPGS
ncbi:MAG: hypothetical protein L3K14_04505 [Thermoplasmata archaeon]|nr:hypothetical protein [Thermoplasmata archaeon]